VDLHHFLPDLGVLFGDDGVAVGAAGDAGIVAECVDAAEMRDHVGDAALHRRLIRHVHCPQPDLRLRRQQGGGLPESLLVEIDQGEPRAFGGQALRSGPADAAAGASDEDNPILEALHLTLSSQPWVFGVIATVCNLARRPKSVNGTFRSTGSSGCKTPGALPVVAAGHDRPAGTDLGRSATRDSQGGHMATRVGTEDNAVEMLEHLMALDYDAIEAYSAAIERLENQQWKAQLATFRSDHERHVHELAPIIRSL